MLILTHVCSTVTNPKISFTIPLTAEERGRSRQTITLPNREMISLQLPRGTFLQEGDILRGDDPNILVKITAKPEKLLRVTASSNLELIKGAYHLGNRHIPLEINQDCLRLIVDPVLANMLIQLGLEVEEEISPFYPEVGAYKHDHNKHLQN